MTSLAIARNTLFNPDLVSAEWRLRTPSTAFAARRSTEVVTGVADGLTHMDGALLNPYTTAPANGRDDGNFVALGTSMTFSLEAKLPASPPVASSSISVSIYSGNNILAMVSCALTPTLTAYTVTANGLTIGATYNVKVHVNDVANGTSVQARAFTRNAQIYPMNAPEAFWEDFQRVPCSPGNMHDTRKEPQIDPSYYPQSPQSRLVVDTDSSAIAFEHIGTYVGTTNPIQVYVNGAPYAVVAVTTTGLSMTPVLALPPGMKRVEVITPNQASSGPWSAATISGLWVRACYFEGSSYVSIVPPIRGARRLVVYGDSIASSMGLIAAIRRDYPGTVLLEAWSGRSLAEDVATGSLGPPSTAAWDEAKGSACAARLASLEATEYLFMIGTNDFGGVTGDITAPNFETCYGNLVDRTHERNTVANFYLVSPIRRAVETANNLGYTLGDYRTAISSVASVRPKFCPYLDGLPILPNTTTGALGDYLDGVHPNENGQERMAVALRALVGY